MSASRGESVGAAATTMIVENMRAQAERKKRGDIIIEF